MSVSYPRLENKVCLVTGGAAGIGAGVVRSMLLENARAVVFLDVAEREGVLLETALRDHYGALRAKFIKCDVSNEDELADAFKHVIDKFLRLDIVVNSAAVLSTGLSFKKTIDVNLTGTVSSTMKAMEIMGADNGGDGGIVLNISSLLALRQAPHLPIYAATKEAVLHFSNAVGADLYSKKRVCVLTVCLGPTDTAILQRQLNLDNFNKDGGDLTSSAPERQKVETAATGILEVINKGSSGSTWMIANDKPPVDITHVISKGFEALAQLPRD